MAKVFVSYTGHGNPDGRLAAFFADFLDARKHTVFIQTKIAPGEQWPAVVDTALQQADHFVLVLSSEAARSDMVIEEVRRAVHLRQSQGRPVILPVRLGEVEMPYDLGAKLNRIQHLKWMADGDEKGIAAKLAEIVAGTAAAEEEPPAAGPVTASLSADGAVNPLPAAAGPLPLFDASWLKQLDAGGGTVRLDSPFYVERLDDSICKQRVSERGRTLLISGPRQIGKSSLLARVYQHARDTKIRAVYLDFQSLGHEQLSSLDNLLVAIATQIYDDLSLNNDPAVTWTKQRTPSQNVTRYLKNEVLAGRAEPLLLLMDEVDRLFQYPTFADDFFALLRFWHERRAVDPQLEWMNMALAYSTEASTFIKNQHQSPFNVGEKFTLSDFSRTQVEQLNTRHGRPVKSQADMDSLMRLLGGHPFLVRHTLYELTRRNNPIAAVLSAAANEDGPFGDHLRYYMLRFHEGEDLKEPMKAVIRSGVCPDDVSFYRLRSAGLVCGPDRTHAQPRCGLYASYFGARL